MAELKKEVPTGALRPESELMRRQAIHLLLEYLFFFVSGLVFLAGLLSCCEGPSLVTFIQLVNSLDELGAWDFTDFAHFSL